MATIKIGNVTGAIYQSEQPFHMNPDGSAQASLTYKCSDASAFAVVPVYLSSHPYYPSLKCFESDIDREPGGIIRITSIYKGVFASNPKQLAQHESQRTLTEAPIETHPKFALPRDNPPVSSTDLAAIELALQNNTKAWATWSDATKLLFSKKRMGIDSYLKPGAVYRKTYVQEDIPSAAMLNKVGKIVTPESPAPSPPTGWDYLLMGVSWNKQAGVVTVTEEYQLSGPGGWDPDLYEIA